jgi:hypothetical protein
LKAKLVLINSKRKNLKTKIIVRNANLLEAILLKNLSLSSRLLKTSYQKLINISREKTKNIYKKSRRKELKKSSSKKNKRRRKKGSNKN